MEFKVSVGTPDQEAGDASTRIDPATLQARGNGEASFAAGDTDVLNLFGDEPDVNVMPVDIPVRGDEVRTFYIKRLSPKEGSTLAVRAKRASNGSIALRDKDAQEAHETALAICACVVKNDGSESAPAWVPLWTYEQVVGRPESKDGKTGQVTQERVRGLLDLSSADGKMFFGLIIMHVYAVNPELNPQLKKKAAELLMAELFGKA